MKNRILIILGICLLAIIVVSAVSSFSKNNPVSQPIEPIVENENPGATATSSPQAFNWIFEQDSSLNPDGNNQTKIILEVKYANDSTMKRVIEVVQGSCFDMTDADADIAPSTKQIQCYYAGLGQRFKIVKTASAYEVRRQIFEEGLPEYNPPMQKYEKVAEFPL